MLKLYSVHLPEAICVYY